jgi:copper oxidase (laccase) domain-containing protein
VLLTVSVADCVPISLVAPERRAVALLHGGWRGIAAGILERGIELLTGRFGARASELHAHLGPAICGRCYEVGPEVHRGLGLPEPSGAQPVDLRAILAERMSIVGIPEDGITCSTHCTRCGDGSFFSHRGGSVERQVAVLGVAAG